MFPVATTTTPTTSTSPGGLLCSFALCNPSLGERWEMQTNTSSSEMHIESWVYCVLQFQGGWAQSHHRHFDKSGRYPYYCEHCLCRVVSLSLTINLAVVAEIFKWEIVRLRLEKLRDEELLTAYQHVAGTWHDMAGREKSHASNAVFWLADGQTASHIEDLKDPPTVTFFQLNIFAMAHYKKPIILQWLSRAESRVWVCQEQISSWTFSRFIYHS